MSEIGDWLALALLAVALWVLSGRYTEHCEAYPQARICTAPAEWIHGPSAAPPTVRDTERA